MEDEQLEIIREASRNTLQLHRRKHKDEEADTRRCIDTSHSSQTEVIEISNKLKTKSPISAAELQSLKNALYEDANKIEIVLNIHGALRGLVRELTGNDINKQCAAAGCLCNLSLGDPKACMVVAKAAGAYLISALDSLTLDLATTSAWTLGNLSSCQQVASVLVAQGAISKLTDMLLLKGERSDAAVYSLTRIVYSMGDELSSEHLLKITEAVSSAELNKDTCQLLFYLSCSKEFVYSQEGTYKVVNRLYLTLNEITNINQHTITNIKCSELDYLLRILANINCENLYKELLSYFVKQNVVGKLKCFMESELSSVCLWLVGNMYNLCGAHVFFEMLFS